MKMFMFVTMMVVLAIGVNGEDSSMPCPFTRELSVSEATSGSDVFILQNLLLRVVGFLPTTGNFDYNTEEAVIKFQKANKLTPSGTFDWSTATALLQLALEDKYRDDGTIPPGYKYKVHIPVYRNRSIETIATLYDANMKSLHSFTVRAHGQNNEQGDPLNQFCNNGSTPTGLSTFDLNSPEPDPKPYGPYPINRAVQGIKGNAAIVISDIRDGILMHTGEWPNWTDSQPMPNSEGCIHGHPTDIEIVWHILVSLGVEVRQNTYGKLPYPYVPQGILSVEQLD